MGLSSKMPIIFLLLGCLATFAHYLPADHEEHLEDEFQIRAHKKVGSEWAHSNFEANEVEKAHYHNGASERANFKANESAEVMEKEKGEYAHQHPHFRGNEFKIKNKPIKKGNGKKKKNAKKTGKEAIKSLAMKGTKEAVKVALASAALAVGPLPFVIYKAAELSVGHPDLIKKGLKVIKEKIA